LLFQQQTVQDEIAIEGGASIILQDSEGNLQKMEAFDSNGNLIYRVFQKLD